MEEWKDPLWVTRFRLLVFLFTCIAIPVSTAHAIVRHSVFGLDPLLTYDVYVGGSTVMIGVHPTPAGDLTFVASKADPVRVVPSDGQQSAGTSGSPARGIGVTLPMPNPTANRFELGINVERPDEVRIRLIEPSTGRVCYMARYPVPGGVSRIRLSVPDNLASGLYLVRVESRSGSAVRKLLLLRESSRLAKR